MKENLSEKTKDEQGQVSFYLMSQPPSRPINTIPLNYCHNRMDQPVKRKIHTHTSTNFVCCQCFSLTHTDIFQCLLKQGPCSKHFVVMYVELIAQLEGSIRKLWVIKQEVKSVKMNVSTWVEMCHNPTSYDVM